MLKRTDIFAGDNCPRITRWSILMVPVVKTGEELPQILTDLRLSDTLQWTEAVVFGEEYTSSSEFYYKYLF